jgi:asparagine synthase (glutamine-hydrolysing)
MCGIVGFIHREPAEEWLDPMLARIEHRGPDGEGRWSGRCGDWFVSLGHRRLAILDIEGGAQPMSTPDGPFHITYNGELYNFRELRRELESRGVHFGTRSDTEVLLWHTALRWSGGLAALDGMFAFAHVDRSTGKVLLARDRVGIKPLYYWSAPDGGLVFASELTALLQHPQVRRRLSARGLESYFFSDYAHGPATLVEGVKKLPPAHYLEWSAGRTPEPVAYWSLAEVAPARSVRRDAELAAELWSRMDRSVERQMVADVPVGVFLSGGIDSSCVATIAQSHASRPLKTFSIAFEDPTFDESNYARIVARKIGSEHVEERLGEKNLLDVVDVALGRLDEPLADPSYLPTFLVSRLAAAHVKVVLGGDGGDEVFGGYPTYRAHAYEQAYRLLPGGVRASLAGVVSRLRERDSYQSLEWKLKRFVLRWDDDPRRRHLRWMSNLDLDDLRRGVPSTSGMLPMTLEKGDDGAPEMGDRLNAVLALDFLTYLPSSVLTKVDRASMAHSLEVRPPLLDNEIVEWVFALPSSLKVRRGRTKYLLKLAARGRLPREIIERPKKGFGIPLRAWLRGPLRDRLARALRPSPLWSAGLLDRGVFEGWAKLHEARRGDYSKALWALIVLDEWVRREKIESADADADADVEVDADVDADPRTDATG